MSILIYLATIFWSLFPNLIHVFQGGEDIINKVNETNLVSNGDFSNGAMGWNQSPNTATEIVIFTDKVTLYSQNGNLVFINQPNILISDLDYYVSINTTFRNGRLAFDGFTTPTYTPNFGDGSFNSFISTATSNLFSIKRQNAVLTDFDVDNIRVYNITDMKLNGVKNDDGILFTDLTNEQIKTQLDTWITEYGSLEFVITKDNTADSWFNTGFVDKEAERDFLDYLAYFFWLMTPPILLFITLDLIRRLL